MLNSCSNIIEHLVPVFQELARRILPLSENYTNVSIFAEARSHFKYGLVNHALAAALKAILQVQHGLRSLSVRAA